jgi:hypothetical protein
MRRIQQKEEKLICVIHEGNLAFYLLVGKIGWSPFKPDLADILSGADSP